VEEKERGKGLKVTGMGRLERINRGSGIISHDDRSNGIKILMTDVFVKINPTDVLRLAKQATRRKRN
jgi:hypothetical protein